MKLEPGREEPESYEISLDSPMECMFWVTFIPDETLMERVRFMKFLQDAAREVPTEAATRAGRKFRPLKGLRLGPPLESKIQAEFLPLHEAYDVLLFAVGRRLLGNGRDAEVDDLVQETWMKAYDTYDAICRTWDSFMGWMLCNHRDQWPKPGSKSFPRSPAKFRRGFKAWLLAVQKNIVIDRQRKKAAIVDSEMVDSTLDKSAKPPDLHAEKEARERLATFLTDLPNKVRRFVEVALEENWDRQAIAANLGVDAHTVDRYRQRLRDWAVREFGSQNAVIEFLNWQR